MKSEIFVGTIDEVLSFTFNNNLKVYKKEIKQKEKEILMLKKKIKQIMDMRYDKK